MEGAGSAFMERNGRALRDIRSTLDIRSMMMSLSLHIKLLLDKKHIFRK